MPRTLKSKTPTYIAARLARRNAEALDDIDRHENDPALRMEWFSSWGLTTGQRVNTLARLGLIGFNPGCDSDTDRREWLLTDLGREVLAVLHSDPTRFTGWNEEGSRPFIHAQYRYGKTEGWWTPLESTDEKDR
jgi:hypothetical protein